MKYLLFTLMFFFSICRADSIDVCFTPGENCAEKIVTEINKAKHEVLVQAYSFTSADILKALIAAEERGIEVKVLIDKRAAFEKNSVCEHLKHNNILPKIDFLPAIAHNKIIIIDDYEVISGSYNFTANAEKRNAENLLLIKDKEVVKKYKANWLKREKVSE